jgi:Tfp pilus assembly protein PilF
MAVSLINDMLKDLDSRERNRGRSLKPGAYDHARDPHPKPRPWVDNTAVLQAVLTLVVAGSIAWWVTHQQELTTLKAAQAARTEIEAAKLAAVPVAIVPLPIAVPQAAVVALQPELAKTEVIAPRREEHKPPRVAAPTPAPAAKTAETIRVLPPPVTIRPVEVPIRAKVTPPQPAVDLALKAEQMYQQALAEQKQGAFDGAMKSWRESLEIYPQHTKARLALAQMLVDRKQAAAAADVLADGLMLLPQQTGFMLAIAPLWIQAGQQNDAMALLAQGVKSANSDPAYHAFYATQLLRLKRPAEAATHYGIALRSEANKSDWLLGLGLSLHGAGNVREAIDALRKASESGGLSAQNKTMVEQVIKQLQTPKPVPG